MKLPSGYGTITKLSGKRRRPYWVRLPCKYSSVNGKLVEERPTLGYYETKQKALEALYAYHKTPYNVSDRSTFEEIFQKWIAEKAQTVSGTTIGCYRSAFKSCIAIHDRPLSELRLADYQAIMDSISTQSRSAVNFVKIVMSGVNAYAMKHEIIAKDYTEYLTAHHAPETEMHRPFTAAEIHKIWDMPPSKQRDITLILLYTGWRINELLKMPADGVDLSKGIMQGGLKTKAGKNRIVPIHSSILPLVMKYTKDECPFKLDYDKYRVWLQDETGHTPHDTRHTFISELQSRGADKVCIQRLVGHTSRDITDSVYTHKDIAELKQTVELVAYKDISMSDASSAV